jgi:inner membrane protein
MDTITQGVLGAVVPQATARPATVRAALVAGWLGGAAPDLDILIRSANDPLLQLEFHRQFTHSLVFIPVGGLVVAAVLWPFFRRQLGFARLVLFTTLGWATHGLLDACTTYGTQLLWPFSTTRVAWNNVGIVDPFYTVPLLALVGLAAWKRRPVFARLGVAWAIAYLLLGVVQRERATSEAAALARSRGHEPTSLTVKPTVGNLLLWRSIYLAGDVWYVDAVRVGIEGKVYPGTSVARARPKAPAGSVLERDLARFAWFSDDALAVHPDDPNVLGDLRYALLPNEIRPLWGIRLDGPPDRHADFVSTRQIRDGDLGRFLDMVLGR